MLASRRLPLTDTLPCTHSSCKSLSQVSHAVFDHVRDTFENQQVRFKRLGQPPCGLDGFPHRIFGALVVVEGYHLRKEFVK